MKVSALTRSTKTEVAQYSLKATEILYRDLFVYANQSGELSFINNSILVNLGLIKVRIKICNFYYLFGNYKNYDESRLVK